MTEKLQEKKQFVKRYIVFKKYKENEAFLTEFLSYLLKLEIRKIEIKHDIDLEKVTIIWKM